MALTLRTVKAVFTADIEQFQKGRKEVEKGFKKTRQEMRQTAKQAEQSQSALSRAFNTSVTVAKNAGKVFLGVTGTLTALLLSLEGVSRVSNLFAKASTNASLAVMRLRGPVEDLGGGKFPRLRNAFLAVSLAGQRLLARIGLLSAGISQLAISTFKGDAAGRKLSATVVKAALGLAPLLSAAKATTKAVGLKTKTVASSTKAVAKMGVVAGSASSKVRRLAGSSLLLKTTLVGLLAAAISKVISLTVGAINKWAEHRKEIIRNIDALGKTSSFLGVNAEQLQALQFAAVTAGVSQENFNTGLQRFLRRLGEAKQGTGTLKKEIDRLGISFTDSNGQVRSGTDLFFEYLQRIEETADKQEKLRLTFAAFDTEGVKLLNLTTLGAERLRNFRLEAERLGLILPTSVIKQMEEMNDQLALNQRRLEVARQRNSLLLNEMAVKWDTLKTNVKLFFLDVFRITDRFADKTENELVKALERANKEVAKLSKPVELPFGLGTAALGAGSGALQAAIQQRDAIQKALEEVRKLNEEITPPSQRADVITEQIESTISGLEREAEGQRRLADALKVSEEQRKKVADAIFIENEVRKLGNQATEEEIQKTLRLATQVVQARREEEKLNEQIRAQEEAQRKLEREREKAVQQLEREQEKREEERQRIAKSIEELRIDVEQRHRLNLALAISREEHERVADAIAVENAVRGLGAEATQKQREELEALTLAQQQAEREARRLQDAQKDKARTLTDSLKEQLEGVQSSGELIASSIDSVASSFVDAAASGKNFGDSMKQIYEELVQEINKAIIKQLILNALIGAVGGTDSKGGGFLAQAFGFAGGKARGGPIPVGQFGLVGEEGPELISGPANITPLKGLAEAVTVQPRIVINNNAPVEVSAQTSANGRDLELFIENTAARSMRSGALNRAARESFGLRNRPVG